MILLTRDIDGVMIVTATERAVLSPTEYTITFVNNVTKGIIKIDNATDTSPNPARYNQFDVDSILFAEHDNGFYTYQITDQNNNILEAGKMKLEGERIAPVQYQDTPTEYTTYGQ